MNEAKYDFKTEFTLWQVVICHKKNYYHKPVGNIPHDLVLFCQLFYMCC